MDYIALSVPIFFLLIFIELFVAWRKQRHLYRFNDAVTNLSCGIGSQILGAYFKVLIFLAYTYIFTHFRLATIQDSPLNWFLLFLGVDFCYYWFHRLSHEINFIWATHIVHHQSEEYNFSVALRQSWFQGLFSWAFYIPLAIAGFSPLMIVTVAAFNTLYQFWIHTRTIDRMGPLEWILNTPSHHRVHHGSNPKYIDKNHAATLIIWDRMFGTFQKEEEEPVYGITSPLNSWNPVWANFHYWDELIALSKQTKSFKDKLLVFIKPPGWRPDYLGGFQAPSEIDRSTYKKFDVPSLKGFGPYLWLQFIGVIALTSYFMFTSGSMLESGDVKLIGQYSALAAYLIYAIYSIGLAFEGRASFIKYEILRLFLLLPLCIGLFGTGILFFISLSFLVVSSVWLFSLRKNLS